MPKISKETMVKDEQKVLEILQSNAKDSIDNITKKFSDRFCIHMQGFIENTELLETIFSIRKQTVKNPHMKRLSEFL